MNEDLFRYKKRFITCILLLGYAFIHVKLTGIYFKVDLDKVVNFSAPLPFGQRLLVPLLLHFMAYIVPVDKLFFLIELIFISLFYLALLKLLQYEFNLRQSQLLSWLFLILLPLTTVVNYRFTTDAVASFFFYYDTPTLFFLAMGFILCLRSNWLYFIPLIFIATINRETSLLLVLMIPILHRNNLRFVYKQIVLYLLVYGVARFLVLTFLHGTPGPLLEWEWYYKTSSYTHFEFNLDWLMEQQNIFLLMFCFAGLPLFWFAFYDYIPILFRPLRYLLLFYFIALLLIGNFPEARLFSEIVLLLYLPVCIALKRWICDLDPIISELKNGVLYYIDRYIVFIILILIVMFRHPLNKWVIWFAN